MNPIDTGSLYYANQTVKTPTASAPQAVTVHGKPKVDKGSELYKQCSEFESIFIKMMLKEMRDSVEKSGLTGGGMGEDIFNDMLYDEYAKSMAKTAGFGLADQVYLQVVRSGGLQ